MEENNFKIKFWLSVALQILVLVGFIFFMQYRLFSGNRVRLKLAPPKDPLSLFQGHYLVLDYEISQLDRSKYNFSSYPKSGSNVYVTLSDTGSYWEPITVSSMRPRKGTYIKGTITTSSNWSDDVGISYGIENYFIPEDKAEEIEKKFTTLLRDENNVLLVEVSLDDSGSAIIRNILVNGEKIDL